MSTAVYFDTADNRVLRIDRSAHTPDVERRAGILVNPTALPDAPMWQLVVSGDEVVIDGSATEPVSETIEVSRADLTAVADAIDAGIADATRLRDYLQGRI